MVSESFGATSLPVPSEHCGDFPGQLFKIVRCCSVNTELIDGNDGEKIHFDDFVAAIEMKRHFPLPLLFKSPLSKALDPRKHGMSTFTEVDHHDLSDFVLFSVRFVCMSLFHTTSFPIRAQETTSDLARNLLAFSATLGEFAKYDSLFPFSFHTMSLYIDMKMIRPWFCSFSDSIPGHHVLNLGEDLQCGEPWKIFPLEFHRLPFDSSQVSILNRDCACPLRIISAVASCRLQPSTSPYHPWSLAALPLPSLPLPPLPLSTETSIGTVSFSLRVLATVRHLSSHLTEGVESTRMEREMVPECQPGTQPAARCQSRTRRSVPRTS